MNFTQLSAVNKKLLAFTSELSSLDAMEKNACRDMTSATETGSLDDPKVQRRIGDCRMKMDLCASRRGHVQRAIRDANSELRSVFFELVKEWNAVVATRREAMSAEVKVALTPLFDGQKRRMETLFNSTAWPCLYEIGRAGWDTSCAHATSEEFSVIVKDFIRHARKFSKLCNLPFEAPESV